MNTSGAAYSRAVDVLPNGRTAVMLQRRAGAANRLELRLGGRTLLLDRAGGGFLDAELRHDSHGRLVAAWRRAVDGGGVQAFTWTSVQRRRQSSATGDSVTHLSLSVAPSGRAALAYRSAGGVFVARRSGTGAFGKPEMVGPAGTFAAEPGIALTSGGRVVVAWTDGRRIVARAASGALPFGAAQVVTLRAPDPGATLVAGAPRVAMTGDGRAVVAVSSAELRGLNVSDHRVEAFEWTRNAARPSAPATLSRRAAAGIADAIATGRAVTIAWTQRPKGAPRSLWTTRWTAKGPQRPHVYDTRALGAAVLLAPTTAGGANVFYRASGARWFTVGLSAAGLFRGTSVVTPPGQSIVAIQAAAAGRHVAAAWTSAGRSPRVQVAHPAP